MGNTIQGVGSSLTPAFTSTLRDKIPRICLQEESVLSHGVRICWGPSCSLYSYRFHRFEQDQQLGVACFPLPLRATVSASRPNIHFEEATSHNTRTMLTTLVYLQDYSPRPMLMFYSYRIGNIPQRVPNLFTALLQQSGL